MKLLLQRILAFIVLLGCGSVNASDKVQWGGLAEIDPQALEYKARKYIEVEMPKLKGVEIRLIQANASYSFEYQSSDLSVLFMHSKSFIEGSSHKRVVFVDDKPGELTMSLIEYIFIEFNSKGEPTKYRVDKVAFNGSKEDFDEEFKKH